MYAGMDAFLSYFFDERVGLLDYFKPSDSLIFFDELTRCTEQGLSLIHIYKGKAVMW